MHELPGVLRQSLPETRKTEPDDRFVDSLIRPITPEDTSFLWEMLYQAIHVTKGAEPPSRDILSHPEIRRYLQDCGQPHDSGLWRLIRRPQSPSVLPGCDSSSAITRVMDMWMTRHRSSRLPLCPNVEAMVSEAGCYLICSRPRRLGIRACL